MIQGDFGRSEGTEPVRFSHSDFGLVVQSLHDTAGEAFSGTEIVQYQFAVRAQGAGEFLHRGDPRAHDLGAPLVEELACPGGRCVRPQLLELLLE